MAGTVEDVIRIAEGELGCTDGSKYFSYFGVGDLGAWCVAGARYCYAKADVDCHWDWSFQAFDWRDAPSQYVVAPSDLKRGDFVAFDWPDDDGYYDGRGDHVGIVTGVHDWGISTIEFNTDWGRVAEKQRLWSVIICGIRPTYKDKDQWIQVDGRWWYRHADGSYTAEGWEYIDGEWYYFDSEGWMYTGWLEWNGVWYYLSEWKEGYPAPEGHMVKGGIFADLTGACYAFYNDGRMVREGDVTATPWGRHDGGFGRLVTVL